MGENPELENMSALTVEKLLRAEVERTGKLRDQANVEFWRVSTDIPSGLPNPDGTHRIQGAAKAQLVAMKEHYNALKRLNAFLNGGEIPEDLRGTVSPS
jgi:hypothetical protein